MGDVGTLAPSFPGDPQLFQTPQSVEPDWFPPPQLCPLQGPVTSMMQHHPHTRPQGSGPPPQSPFPGILLTSLPEPLTSPLLTTRAGLAHHEEQPVEELMPVLEEKERSASYKPVFVTEITDTCTSTCRMWRQVSAHRPVSTASQLLAQGRPTSRPPGFQGPPAQLAAAAHLPGP